MRAGRGNKLAWIAAGLVAGVLLGPIAAEGASSVMNVIVSNSPDRPVPTKVQGTARVSLAAPATVTVANKFAGSVPVTTGKPTRLGFSFTIPRGQGVGEVTLPVPAKKILIVRQVSADASYYQHPMLLYVYTLAGPTFFPMAQSAVNGNVLVSDPTEISATGYIKFRVATSTNYATTTDVQVNGAVDGVLVPQS